MKIELVNFHNHVYSYQPHTPPGVSAPGGEEGVLMNQHELTEKLLDDATGFNNNPGVSADLIAQMLQRQREFAQATSGRRERAWLERLEAISA